MVIVNAQAVSQIVGLIFLTAWITQLPWSLWFWSWVVKPTYGPESRRIVEKLLKRHEIKTVAGRIWSAARLARHLYHRIGNAKPKGGNITSPATWREGWPGVASPLLPSNRVQFLGDTHSQLLPLKLQRRLLHANCVTILFFSFFIIFLFQFY